jgi:hypothetical protein
MTDNRMPSSTEPSWVQLFSNQDGAGSRVTLRWKLLRRGGEPLLLAPLDPKSAAVALSLYPAQRTRARYLRAALRQAWRLGIPVNIENVTASIIPDAPFPTFLAQQVEGPRTTFPPLAILCGNPMAKGRRFVILVFGPGRTPAAVVKAGVGEAATGLVEQEETFLNSTPRAAAAIPKLRGIFHGTEIRALALDFAPGEPPAHDAHEKIGRLLTSWLETGSARRLGSLPAWRVAEEACRSHPAWERAAAVLRDRQVHSTVFHGDFAPWNIKVSPHNGSWTVLDWERGDLLGIPGWDWFHYVFQYGVLVSRLRPPGLVRTMRELFRHEAFQRYAAAASIKGVVRELFLAYVLCYNRIFNSPESGADFDKLLQGLAELNNDE